MPNPNEEYRKMEERYEEIMTIVHDLRNSKSVKQEALTEARRLERILGIESENYNGRSK